MNSHFRAPPISTRIYFPSTTYQEPHSALLRPSPISPHPTQPGSAHPPQYLSQPHGTSTKDERTSTDFDEYTENMKMFGFSMDKILSRVSYSQIDSMFNEQRKLVVDILHMDAKVERVVESMEIDLNREVREYQALKQRNQQLKAQRF